MTPPARIVYQVIWEKLLVGIGPRMSESTAQPQIHDPTQPLGQTYLQQQQSSLSLKIFGVHCGSSTNYTCILFRQSILSEVILSVIFLIKMSFFTTSINVIFYLPLPSFVPSTWINSFFLIGTLISLLWTWSNHLKRLSFIFSSIEATPIFKQISSFRILSFLVVPLIHLNILISTTPILWNMFLLNSLTFSTIEHSWSYCSPIKLSL